MPPTRTQAQSSRVAKAHPAIMLEPNPNPKPNPNPNLNPNPNPSPPPSSNQARPTTMRPSRRRGVWGGQRGAGRSPAKKILASLGAKAANLTRNLSPNPNPSPQSNPQPNRDPNPNPNPISGAAYNFYLHLSAEQRYSCVRAKVVDDSNHYS